MITTVFIDIDNTLLDFKKSSELSMEKVFEELDIPYEKSMYSVFTEVNNSLWEQIEKGNLTRGELFLVRWNLILGKLGVDYDGVKFEEKFLKQLACSAVPIMYAKEILEYLYPKYTICAASNAPYEQQLIRLKSAGFIQYIHKFFISEKVGFSKPDRKFFDVCIKSLAGVAADNIILIGDSPTADIKGANEYGIKNCWFNPDGNSLPPGISADYTISSLREIKNIL